jgi:hypothetical protein
LEFVVVGGYAGVVHGSALITNDVDTWPKRPWAGKKTCWP